MNGRDRERESGGWKSRKRLETLPCRLSVSLSVMPANLGDGVKSLTGRAEEGERSNSDGREGFSQRLKVSSFVSSQYSVRGKPPHETSLNLPLVVCPSALIIHKGRPLNFGYFKLSLPPLSAFWPDL